MKKLLTGNEAVARGVYESGCTVAAAYPGTPSTEILEEVSRYQEIYSEWSPNEKVALEVAGGAALAGSRAFCSMKHVGLNVAADPLFTIGYTGITGGLVINTSDEPGMHSSQNEQDNRYYAKHAKIPLVIPSDSQQCVDFLLEAYRISEAFDTAVLFRTTTRVCHSKSLVGLSSREEPAQREYAKDLRKNLMTPGNSRPKHHVVEQRLEKLAEYAETSPLNFREGRSKAVGIITTGIAYQYAREVFGSRASYLYIGFCYPLPLQKIKQFARGVDTLLIIEENEPFIEDEVRKLGIDCLGKDRLPLCDEFSVTVIEEAFLEFLDYHPSPKLPAAQLPPRPPALCPGCPHRGIFHALSSYKNVVASTDIGCYTLGAFPPLNVGDFLFCMGSSITAGIGFARSDIAYGRNDRKVFALIGDSTFFHSGMTGLADVVYSNTPVVTVILDNRITAMTGHQENPGTGKRIDGTRAPEIDLAHLAESLGVSRENIRVIHPNNLKQCSEALKDAYESEEPFVIITRAPCALLPEVRRRAAEKYYQVSPETCVGCKACIRIGCPAIRMEGKTAVIESDLCAACGVCFQVCRPKAISMGGK